ncbi:peptide/nickel transport system permease protein [Gammaproteobacteria bacterium]
MTMPLPVLLWTDILWFLLLTAVVLFALRARRHEHLRAPWRRVARNPVAMASATVLVVYLLIALLDSLHFHPALENDPNRHSSEILSVLDVALAGLRQGEKTFSAPFATHAFAKETLPQPDGTSRRDYPRLLQAGTHLADPVRDRFWDLALRASAGFVVGLLVWGLLGGLWLGGRAWWHGETWWETAVPILTGRSEIPWRVIWVTLGILLVLTVTLGFLAPHYHVLGTDKVGEDVLYQSLKSVRTGLVIGTVTTLVMLPLALLLGILAGYWGDWVDDVIQYLYTTLNSIPGVLLIAAAVLILQGYLNTHADQFPSLVERADLRLLFLCLILGMTSWTGLCRLLRAETLKLREMEYVQAAVALGVRPLPLLLRHILPNVMHIVLITVALDFSGLVLAEAVLSYVNIGVDPTMQSWGNMINSARLELAREPVVWWPLSAAFLFMLTLVLTANLFADGVRDALDPRLRHSREGS